MQTKAHIAAALGLVVAFALGTGARPTPALPHNAAPAVNLTLHQTRTRGNVEPVAPKYGWPVTPCDRQHPVRAFLNDPRIGHHGSHAFHFGIDISAPDGTRVYA